MKVKMQARKKPYLESKLHAMTDLYFVFVFLLLLSLFIPASSFSQEFTAATLGDYGNVTVMEVSGNYDAKNSDGTINAVPREVIAKEFFKTHKDEFDFLVIFSNFNFAMPNSDAVAFYTGVKNDTQGIGERIFDNSSLYGSSSKLQGTIDMGSIDNLVMDPLDPAFDFTLDTISHEMMHRWAARVKFRDGSGDLSNALLGKDGSHWSFLLDTNASLMLGNTWLDNGDGTFTSIKARKYYSPLDLYLMGFIEKSEVPQMLLIDNPDIDPKRVSEIGVTIQGTARYVTIDDIIAAEGERIPGPADSQKSFKTAFIFITSPGTFAGYELYWLELVRSGWMTRYSILTDGRGLVQVVPSPIDNIATNPGVTPPVPPSPTPSGMDNGVAWLMSNQRSDGSWQNVAQTAVRDTAEATSVLKNFTNAQANYTSGLQWLSGAESVNVDYLSRQIESLSASGQDVQALVSELALRQNSDGGWGSSVPYESTPVDTAYALRALNGSQYADQNPVTKSVEYLIAKQRSDGGWGFHQEDNSNVLMTATVLGDLQRVTSTVSVAAAIEKAKTYILAHQNSDGGFGSSPSTVYETALAYLTLPGLTTDGTVLGNALKYLKSQQSADGSWLKDPYSTALALRVLYLTKDLPSPPPGPATSTVTGKILDGTTNQPLQNVTVVLLADGTISATTNAAGNFTLMQVPPGSQNISFSLSGYMTTTIPADISSGSIIDIGTNSLYPVSTAGIIRGSVTDITNGGPLANAIIEVMGAFTGTATTGADGSFIIGNVIPGSLTLKVSKDGYYPVSGAATVNAGEVLFFYPQLRPVSPQPTTGSASGKVIDASSGQPLSGVSVVLQSDASISTVTDSTGSFTLSNITPGAQKISLSLSGYSEMLATLNITAGLISDLGVLSLGSNATVGVIKGIVTDAAKVQPLEGVTIAVSGSFSGSTATGTDGGFVIGNVTPGTITVTASKPGYYELMRNLAITAGEVVFLNLQLTIIPPQSAKGAIIGKVVDLSTGQPLQEVSVVLQSDTNINTVTDQTGSFSLSNIPPGGQTIRYSLSGYSEISATVNITAGLILDLGALPLSSTPTVGVMKGTVTNADKGQPIEGVTIAVTGSFTGSTVTGTDGGFVIGDITPGSITFTASKQGYYSLNGSLTITAGEITYFNFQMTQPGTLRGKVYDIDTDTTMTGARISILGGSEASTDEQGVFIISGVVPGKYEVNISASGYLSQTYQIIITDGATTDMHTISLSPILTSTTLTGRVTDTSTGNPISNADIEVVGTSIAAKTDSSGAFTLSGINLLEFNLKASATGYDTRFNGMQTEAYGQYMIDIGLSRSQASTIEIIALGTDNESYSANNLVTITANISNTGATPVDVIITAQVMDEDNNLLAVIAYDTDPDVTLNPNGSETASLQWDTGLYPPGNYNVFLSVIDSGKGVLLAEGSTFFSIVPTIAVDGLVPLITPKFLNIGSTETVTVSASVTNSSNIDVSLSAEYEVRDPDGNIINGSTVDFTITPAESLKTVELGRLTYTFGASGQFPVTVKISSGGSVVMKNSAAIYISPSMRIEATKILSPTTVAPDGDKPISIDIRLEGVEVTE